VVNLPFGPVGRKYVLTASHAVSVDKAVRRLRTPFGIMEIIFDKKKSQSVYLMQGKEKIELKVLMREGEAALLELPFGVDIPALSYGFGKSGDLEIGDAIYVLGYPLGSAQVNVRKGFVTDVRALYFPDFMGGEYKQVKEEYPPEDFFMIKDGVVPGDSGGPILAIRDGKRELVGLTSAVALDFSGQLLNFCYVLHSDKILDKIKRFFENDEFENDEL